MNEQTKIKRNLFKSGFFPNGNLHVGALKCFSSYVISFLIDALLIRLTFF